MMHLSKSNAELSYRVLMQISISFSSYSWLYEMPLIMLVLLSFGLKTPTFCVLVSNILDCNYDAQVHNGLCVVPMHNSCVCTNKAGHLKVPNCQ